MEVSRKKLGIPLNEKILLNVASYNIRHKNQINLLKAASILKKEGVKFKLYLIGEGNDYSNIKGKIKLLNLQDNVKLLGPKPNREIPLWMNAANLFVFPSYSESFGVVNVEALACGTPVISTVNGGSEEIISSDDYGFLLEDPEDYVGLSKLMKKGLNKEWNKKRIIEYSKKYEVEKIIKKLIDKYKVILD